MTILHIDFETRSALDLRKVGLHRYARHPTTDVWCMAWAFDDGEVGITTADKFSTVMRAGRGAKFLAGRVCAHNAPFELEIWNQIMVPRYGWPPLQPEQTFCTMAACYAMGLPGALEDAALALGLAVLKDAEGRALMLRMSRPRDPVRMTWWDEPEKLKRLYAYCQQDVRVERELHKRLMPLSEKERRVWLLDYKINQRGVAVDLPSARAGIALAERMKLSCAEEISSITGGAVQAITAVGALKAWMASRGVKVDSLAKQALSDLLTGVTDIPAGLPADVRRALVLRQEAGKASTAKLDVMVDRAGDDGRLRQMYQYHGAATGRWAARGVQPHNLPRNMPKAEAVERILELMRAGKHEAIDAIYGAPLSVLSQCLRAFFVAPPGRKLISGDWSNIESRGAAWFAGETWKLKAFFAQDDGSGPDVYKLGASRLLGIPVDAVTDEQRQSHGKVPDLAFQYQGGVGSGHTMGKTYGVKATDDEWRSRRDAWRAAHPRISAVWRGIEQAAIRAVQVPGEVTVCGHPERQAKFKMAGSFLWLLLPSGRAICYSYPKLLEGAYGPQLTYMTVPSPEDKKKGKIIDDPKNTSNWARIGTYGGSLLNNIVQGFSRDFLAECMLAMDAAGAEIVLHTHDDVNIEVDDAKAEKARDAMQEFMLRVPAWAKGFPLKAKPAIMQRYGKT